MNNVNASKIKELIYKELFFHNPKCEKTWSRVFSKLVDPKGVYLFECDRGANMIDHVMAYVINELLLHETCTHKVLVLNIGGECDDIDISASGVCDLVNSYVMDDDPFVALEGLEPYGAVYPCKLDTNSSIHYNRDVKTDVNQPLDVVVLGAENMSWSEINDFIIGASTGEYSSVMFFNNGLITEDERNPLFKAKMKQNPRYNTICALDFDRDGAKRYISTHGLGDSVKNYPCAIKEILSYKI